VSQKTTLKAAKQEEMPTAKAKSRFAILTLSLASLADEVRGQSDSGHAAGIRAESGASRRLLGAEPEGESPLFMTVEVLGLLVVSDASSIFYSGNLIITLN